MKKRTKKLNYYPETNHQYHSYGIRYWDGERWMYWGSKYSKKKGHVEQWVDNEYKCQTDTSILDTMFKAQSLSFKNKVGVEVIRFEEPTVEWVTHYNNRPLDRRSQ